MIKCKKCQGICKPSKAFINTYSQGITTTSDKTYCVNLVNCHKCTQCGHSFTI